MNVPTPGNFNDPSATIESRSASTTCPASTSASRTRMSACLRIAWEITFFVNFGLSFLLVYPPGTKNSRFLFHPIWMRGKIILQNDLLYRKQNTRYFQMSDAKQPHPPDPIALAKSGPLDAATLLCMVAGRTRIELPGFDEPKPNLLTPGIRLIKLSKSGKTSLANDLILHRQRTVRTVTIIALLLAATVLFSAFLPSLFRDVASAAQIIQVPAEWRVATVEGAGVRIRSGQQEILLPIGSRLPNGDVLLSTNPTARSYTTPTSVTTISAHQ